MKADSLDPSAFAPAGRPDWLKAVDKALKGADFRETLVSASDDGIAIEPLYARHVGATPLTRRLVSSPWTATQRIDDPSAARAMRQLDDDIANGATGISLVFAGSGAAYGTGLAAAVDMTDVVARLSRSAGGNPISLRLEGAPHPLLHDFTPSPGADGRSLHLGLASLQGDAGVVADIIRSGDEATPVSTVLNADGRPVHNAGGTEAQELAVMAATVALHLRDGEEAGIAPEAILPAVSLCLCADQDQFMTIAKARAARLIFSRIAEACGVGPAPKAHLFLETSYRMLTRLDPETNLLRNTIAVFAAGVGGADEISVLPHTLVHGLPDPQARRLARNMQTVLIAESHLDHVGDPAAGAGGIEALTDALCERAWTIFAGIEREGGLRTAIDSGRLAAMVAEARRKRAAGPIVGTTLFPAMTERPVSVLGPLGTLTAVMGLMPVRLDEAEGG